MNLGTKIALGFGGYLLYTRMQAPAATGAASSPAAAANNALASLQNTFSNLLKQATGQGANKPSGSGGGGGSNPAGGSGSGRSPGGTQLSNVENAFGTFDNLNGPSSLQQEADMFNAAVNSPVDDPSFSLPGVSSGAVDSGTGEVGGVNVSDPGFGDSSGVPGFAGEIDPNTGLAVIPDANSGGGNEFAGLDNVAFNGDGTGDFNNNGDFNWGDP